MELVGVSLITQLVSLISSPESIQESKWLRMLYDMSGATDNREFFLFVVIVLIGVYLFKNLVRRGDQVYKWVTVVDEF